MTNVKLKCPFCKTPVTITPADRVDVQCSHCGKVWRVPPPAVNVEYGWYFIGEKKQQAGPVSREKLQERAKTGLLKPGDMIRQEGNQKWQQARSVSGLFPAPAYSCSRKKKWAWLAGSAAAVLLAALLLIGQLPSPNRVHKPDQVAAKTKEAATEPAEKQAPVPSLEIAEKPREAATEPAARNAVPKEKQKIYRYLVDRSGKQIAKSAPPKEFFTQWCREQYDECKNDRKLLYERIAEHLLSADDNFLGSKDKEVRRKGIAMAEAACICVTDRVKNPWLAARIAEEYLLANLDVGADAWEFMSKESMLETANGAYALARDVKKMLETHKLLILWAPNRNAADACRLRMAMIHDSQREYEEALELLHKISLSEGVDGAKTLIPGIEKKRREKRAKEVQNEIKK